MATDVVDFTLGIREGTGMDVDTFTGPYFVAKFAANTSLGITHTYAVVATETGHGLGAFAVAKSSDPAAIGVISPFNYTVEDNGNIFFTDSHEEGKIKSDGSYFIAGDTDPTNHIQSIMFLLYVTFPSSPCMFFNSDNPWAGLACKTTLKPHIISKK
jgi:hypothetical protein